MTFRHNEAKRINGRPSRLERVADRQRDAVPLLRLFLQLTVVLLS